MARSKPAARPAAPSQRRSRGLPPSPAWILRAEGLGLLVTAVLGYHFSGRGWGLFALAFFVPDVGLLGYLKSSRLGAWCYNLTHSSLLPLAWFLYLWFYSDHAGLWMSALWLAHVGFDRVLGFGLQYGADFKVTHIQKV